MTHSARTPAAASVISEREGTFLGERLEHLRRPDYRNMRRFADPQNLLLHFRQALITAFNRKVATRDHYADSGTAHRRQKERGQLLECLACLNFQNNSDVLRSQLLHPRLEIADVGFRSYEGVSEHICIARNKVQSRDVVRGEGRNPKFALRQVDTLFGAQLASLYPSLDDLDFDSVPLNRSDDSADLSVVEFDFFPDQHVIEKVRLGHPNRRRAQEASLPIVHGGPARCGRTEDGQRIATPENQGLRLSRNVAHAALLAFAGMGGAFCEDSL